MILFELDVEDGFERLEENYEFVISINHSLADKRSEYREFSENIDLDFDALDNCCKSFENTILIGMYTFSEQLIKNFFYKMIGFETYTNESLNRFVESKVPKERFSPSPKYFDIENTIKKQLFKDFKYILSKDRTEITMYNEMVNSRHRYAHKGHYAFNVNNFYDILKIQKYIYFELKMLVIHDFEYRLKFQSSYFDIKNSVFTLSKVDQSKIKFKSEELRQIRSKCLSFFNKYNSLLADIEMLQEINEKIRLVSIINLNKKIEALTIIKDLKSALL